MVPNQIEQRRTLLGGISPATKGLFKIARDCGIEITVARTEIGGLCQDCRAKA